MVTEVSTNYIVFIFMVKQSTTLLDPVR